MHYNHPLCGNSGNALSNGYGSAYNTFKPASVNNVLYPNTVVGEGDVTCLTLPDGTCQFYFTPTANWMTANTYPGFNTTNYYNINPHCNPNIGTWFVRSITTPVPAVCNNSLHQRYEAPIPLRSLDYNRCDNGFQLKFHNDKWTSTTDIHYFYPCLRYTDHTIVLPAKGNATVQVNTPLITNTICHYEVVPSKLCSSNHTCVNTCVSAMSLDAITKPTEAAICKCVTPLQRKRGSTNNSLQRLQLLKSDATKKRIKLERNKQIIDSKSKDVNCECPPPPCENESNRVAYETFPNHKNNVQASSYNELETPGMHKESAIFHPAKDPLENIFPCQCTPSLSSEGITQNVSKAKDVTCQYEPQPTSSETVKQTVNKSNSKVAICQCDPPPLSLDTIAQTDNVNKTEDFICQCEVLLSENSNTTPDFCTPSKCDFNKTVPSPCCCAKDCLEQELEMWRPITDSLKNLFQGGKGYSQTACCSRNC